MKRTSILGLLAAGLVASGFGAISQPGAGPTTRYATDAYPGFDNESEIVAPSKKEPRWFAWIVGPDTSDPTEQLAHCQGLEAEQNWSKAARQYDALVRNWPVSKEAPIAQRRYAELLLERLDNAEDAFAEFRYLADFYTIHCDFAGTVDKMHEVAQLMRKQGKDILFFHFDNTVDVRRAFEACVLRAPGADWVRSAMLTVAELRVDEGKLEEAVKVYENLRNLHAGSPEAREAYYREACVRMQLLDDHAYNRTRCLDTIDFLKQAIRNCELDRVDDIKMKLAAAQCRYEDETYLATRFYDSKTRTVRSAINAYERFLAEFPDSPKAEAVRARLEELKGLDK